MKDRRALRRREPRPAAISPRQADDFLHQVFTEFPLPAIIHDERNHILLMSKGWTQFSGYTLEDVHTIADWIDRALGGRKEYVKEYIDALFAENGTLDHGEWVIAAKSGENRVWHFLTTRLGVFPGRRLILTVASDVTERKRVEEALRQTEELLRQGVQVAHLGIFEHDQVSENIYWSPEMRLICGWESQEPVTLSEFVQRIHPEDRDRIVAAIRRAHDPSSYGIYDVEHRIILPNGAVRWVRVKSQTFFEGTGPSRRPVRTVGALLDVTAGKQAEEERERLIAREQELRAAAEAANRMKDDFLSTLSHELRTPMTSILGWSGLLRERSFDAETVNHGLETIERSAKAQQRLIEDILDVSRIISGSFRLVTVPLQLGPIVESAIETICPAAEAKSIRLQSQLDRDVVVSGDPDRLLQVAWNLLSNAIKFTPQQGSVNVRLRRADYHAELTVEDSGQGISPELLPCVFERFWQADSTIARKHGGLGLGLAITRHIVELHGGSVYATSSGENQGATFSVKLPLLINHS